MPFFLSAQKKKNYNKNYFFSYFKKNIYKENEYKLNLKKMFNFLQWYIKYIYLIYKWLFEPVWVELTELCKWHLFSI